MQQNAERAYRRAFMKAAREAASWAKIDMKFIDKAWKERRRVREAAQICVPSAVVFGDPSMDSEQIVYRPGQQFETSRTRGRVHGFEFVRQCSGKLVKRGFDEKRIGPEIIQPWLVKIEEWFASELDPDMSRSRLGPMKTY